MSAADDGFLTRWARRKARVRAGAAAATPGTRADRSMSEAPAPPADAPAPCDSQPPRADVPTPCDSPPPRADAPTPGDAPPTLADVARLDRDADYARFVARGVDPEVRNAALRKLFSDPHFNAMDGLDTYVDDYGAAVPLPARLLRRMVQAGALGLRADDDPPVDGSIPTEAACDEDPGLRLQPLDDDRRADAAPGADGDAGRER